jgi:hypothetical protein
MAAAKAMIAATRMAAGGYFTARRIEVIHPEKVEAL